MKRKRSSLKKSKRSPAQIRGILVSKQIGSKLVRDHPEIAQEWSKGAIEKELGKKYCPNDSEDVARNAIHYALKRLIRRKKTRVIIAKKHIHQGCIKGGKTVAKKHRIERTGLWAMSPEERRKATQKGGRIGGRKMGKKNYRLGLGIARLTPEQLHEQGKKLARLKGQVPYEDTERETEFGLLNEKQYIISLKLLEDLSWAEITKLVNKIFGNNRRLESIRTLYNQKWRREIAEL